ncbi:hypothetical protein ACFP1Z_20345 [Streptomyces gamaensis]|uniref:Integral membrane protein n=1 Tax=Streptomyces gamaensis TaxID=1763542 RepID=A0ABW0Z338_9ACTN
MGIESDQLVYDYLSRVGDIAQRQAFTSAERMRLVSRLRTEIERRRAAEGADTPAAVQRILAGLGSPDEAVADAGHNAGAADGARVPAPRREEAPRPAVPADPPGAAPPHLAGEAELGGPAQAGPDPGEVPEWWRADRRPFTGEAGPYAGREPVHGFVGGIEIPDILKPPPPPGRDGPGRDGGPGERSGKGEGAEKTERVEKGAEDGGGADAGAAQGQETAARQGFHLLRRPDGAPVPVFLLLVSLLLVVGAVLGNWLVLAAGWALAYVTRKLSYTESQWAVLFLPGLTVTGAVVWLWGRTAGRWGDPVPQGAMGQALADTWPWAVRVAALASAAYVMWRARRPG